MTFPQQRSVSVALGHMEAQLHAIERLLSIEQDDLLRHYTNDLSPAEAMALHSIMTETRQTIAEAVAALDLEPQVTDVRRAIAAILGLLWTVLEDNRPSKLGRYGPVDPSLEASLGPRMDRLIAQVRAMEAIVSRERQGAP